MDAFSLILSEIVSETGIKYNWVSINTMSCFKKAKKKKEFYKPFSHHPIP